MSASTFVQTIANTTTPAGLAPEGMVWITGGEFSMGAQDPPDMNDAVGMQATTDCASDRPRVSRWFLDGHDGSDQRAFRGIVKATGIWHARGAAGCAPRICWGRRRRTGRRHRGVLAARSRSAARRSFSMVVVRWMVRTGAIHLARRARSWAGDRLSRCARRIRGRARVRDVGREASAFRGGMGICRAWGAERTGLSLGQRVQAREATGWRTAIRVTFPITTREPIASSASHRFAHAR